MVRVSSQIYGLPLGVQPEVVEEAGWAVVFHRDEDEAVKQAFAPLIEHRKQQVRDYRGQASPGDEVDIVKTLTYQGDEGDDANAWLARTT